MKSLTGNFSLQYLYSLNEFIVARTHDGSHGTFSALMVMENNRCSSEHYKCTKQGLELFYHKPARLLSLIQVLDP